jgi:luciferase family oxidoreductase group 1
MRIGSGGVMLPNHAPLQVAERYKVLEGLFPGRIDLGLGRAPGTDPVTSYALRRRQEDPAADDFLDRFQELLLFEQQGFPQGHPFRNVRPMPQDVALPPIYLLGSSDYSAQLAAHVGAGFSFAHHFSDFDPVGPMTAYRAQYKPSEQRPVPHAILALHVVAADTDAEAERLATSVDLNFARRRQGHFAPIPSPEEAAAHEYTPTDRAWIARNRARLVVGSKATVLSRLEPLIEDTQADEVMITTMIYDHQARKHSYALMAEAFGLQMARDGDAP